MDQRIRFCTTRDGVRLVRGEAPTVFVSSEVDGRLDRRCDLAE